MIIPTVHLHSDYSKIPLRIAKGHFATNHSHINYYIDMTYTKHRLGEAREAARELAVRFVSSPAHDSFVDTVFCLDGTEVLGACLAEELIALKVRNKNEHHTPYVLAPESTAGNQYIFRENSAHLIKKRHVLLMAASVTTGTTIHEAAEAVRYYGGTFVGACSIFSCLQECDGYPVISIFQSNLLENYSCLPASQCPLCQAGVKLDGLVNSYGISSFYR